MRRFVNHIARLGDWKAWLANASVWGAVCALGLMTALSPSVATPSTADSALAMTLTLARGL